MVDASYSKKESVWLGRGNTTANVLYSKMQTVWSGNGNELVSGYTVHTTTTKIGNSKSEGALRQIGVVFQRGAKQTGKWAALRHHGATTQHGFSTRADAGRWLLRQAIVA